MPEKRLYKVVLDTNVFISGLILPKSLPGKILELWRENKFILVISPKILAELNRALYYPKILKTYKLKEKLIRDLLRTVIKASYFITEERVIKVVTPDPADNKFLSCAISAKADFIVSGDKHLLKLKNFQGISVVSPKEFIKKFSLT